MDNSGAEFRMLYLLRNVFNGTCGLWSLSKGLSECWGLGFNKTKIISGFLLCFFFQSKMCIQKEDFVASLLELLGVF